MEAARSDWKQEIEQHLRTRFASTEIVANDTSIVPRRRPGETPVIDLYLPELHLGISLNDERYCDRAAYVRDKALGSCKSEEMYKEIYCRKHGVKLLNIWSSDYSQETLDEIDKAVIDLILDEFLRDIRDYSKKRSKETNERSYLVDSRLARLKAKVAAPKKIDWAMFAMSWGVILGMLTFICMHAAMQNSWLIVPFYLACGIPTAAYLYREP